MTAIKICGLTSLTDARCAWTSGADLLGFIFVPASPRCVTPETVRPIVEALRGEGCQAKLVGVFASAPAASMIETVQGCQLDLVQLHGDEGPAYAEALHVPYILARRVGERVPWDDLTAYSPWALLLDSYQPGKLGGTGQTWDWRALRTRPTDAARLMVAGGLNPSNVAEAIRQTGAWGVDVSSGVERSPGRKDHDLIARFVKSVREGDEQP